MVHFNQWNIRRHLGIQGKFLLSLQNETDGANATSSTLLPVLSIDVMFGPAATLWHPWLTKPEAKKQFSRDNVVEREKKKKAWVHSIATSYINPSSHLSPRVHALAPSYDNLEFWNFLCKCQFFLVTSALFWPHRNIGKIVCSSCLAQSCIYTQMRPLHLKRKRGKI